MESLRKPINNKSANLTKQSLLEEAENFGNMLEQYSIENQKRLYNKVNPEVSDIFKNGTKKRCMNNYIESQTNKLKLESVDEQPMFSLQMSAFKNSVSILKSEISIEKYISEPEKELINDSHQRNCEEDDTCNADIESSDDGSQNRDNFCDYTEFKRDDNTNDFWIGGENFEPAVEDEQEEEPVCPTSRSLVTYH